MSVKTVTLPETMWNSICAVLEKYEDPSFAAVIKEQITGRMSVRSSRRGAVVTLKAGKGGDLRGVIEAITGGSA